MTDPPSPPAPVARESARRTAVADAVALAGNATPDDAPPDDTAPDDTAPDDTAPDDTAPDDTAPDDTAPDDAAVITLSLTQPERFAVLFHRYAPAIHQYAARRLGVDAADDVTAETFLTAFRIRARYDPARASARPWLYGIAARLIGHHRRDEIRALRIAARGGADPVAESWTESADDRVTAQAAAGPLAHALAGLSSGDRHVLLLFAWADLSYQEVAEALEIPIGTVRSRLNRARRKLRATLGEITPLPQHPSQEGERP